MDCSEGECASTVSFISDVALPALVMPHRVKLKSYKGEEENLPAGRAFYSSVYL